MSDDLNTDQSGHEPKRPPHVTAKPNGSAPPPDGQGPAPRLAEDLRRMEETASKLLRPAPSALTDTGHQTVIPLLNVPQQLWKFRTHPTIRLTMPMVCPGKGNLGAHTYAVMPDAEPYLARESIEPFTASLFPIMIASRPITYALVMVRLPTDGKKWDNWALTKKLVLDEAVSDWRSMRRAPGGGYQAHPPNSGWSRPIDAEFPDYSEAQWLHLSLGVTDLIVHDGTHSMFQEING